MNGGATELRRRDTFVSMTVVTLLLLLYFLLHPWLHGLPAGPDLLIGGLLLAALRVQAGTAAILGFVLGPLEAAMSLGDPGVYALVLTTTGYLAARSRDILFADAPVFVVVYLFVGTWLARSVLVLATGGVAGDPAGALLVVALDALATALVCGMIDALTTSFVRRA
ncbi:MAG TPA: rod shape-determining protein MreD [Gemmatimonadota bacterium]|nr:rod shape-determining protein MreD [Gemmatimonadota bacterium]